VVSRFPVAVVDDPPADLPDLLGRLVRRDPAATAVIDIAPGGRVVEVSRVQLWRRTCVLAERLAEAGVGTGDRVAVWLPNWSDALCWQFATAALGAHVIGVNTRYNVDEVTHLLTMARPRLVAVAHGFHGLHLRERLVEAARRAAAARPEAGTAAADPPQVAVVPGPGTPAAPTAAELAGYDLGAGAWTPPPAQPPVHTARPVLRVRTPAALRWPTPTRFPVQ